jgi:hypothetical protein
MNKILVYTVLAILLGTVTMIAPLALLEQPEQPMLTTTTADNSDARLSPQKDTLGAEDTLTAPELPEPTPSSPDFSTQGPESASPEEPNAENAGTYNISAESGLVSGLSSIGLMIVPSFLIAVGVFVYLKKRV